ncbi:myoneurin-like [Zootermopsis nevadensis]|uniref:C2H2-type domain-containing protein n=1 Tax=Zootermopsis nevadensis TaxID=136037 RepID=A0A067QYY3_ZOONE|nr:myoneurin-like [Zootermopsis nevadensis]XP_021928872.1 myoneurin-like [Zootermopsis nevadensis]XP_021928873.1 myoneurin-like [Zootermopsis nevadensis]XP_021928874.1 myoneurin-like [Zootermopsis nevadensis]KDR14732.1 hypothetical protein L798_11660 [Zootermopsis nevadensis]
MQTHTEVTSLLGCSDCKSSFNSASLLLQHFAQHVSQEAIGCQLKHVSIQLSDDVAQCIQKHASVPDLQKKKTETILEKVLKRNSALRHLTVTSHCEPGPSAGNEDIGTFPDTSLSSPSSVLQTVGPDQLCCMTAGSLKTEVLKNNTSPGLDMLLEIGQHGGENSQGSQHIFSSSSLSSSSSSYSSSDVQLVKYDLQKRLENCITKLTSKQENGLKSGNKKSFKSGATNLSEPDKKIQLYPVQYKPNSELAGNISAIKMEEYAKSNEESEDFNPLKFCFVTLEESEGNAEEQKGKVAEESMVKTPRGASSRKQKTPKKVYYHQNGKLNHNYVASELVSGDSEKVVSSCASRKKYPCHLCSKVFGWSTDLKRHILTHTGERPFKCSACQATFTRNFLLQKHQRKIHSSCFTVSQESAISSLYPSSNKEQIWKGVKEESENSTLKCMTQCSDDSDEDRLVICDDEKPNGSVPSCMGTKSQHKNSYKINSAKKRKELQYKISSYGIFSHEALNIL